MSSRKKYSGMAPASGLLHHLVGHAVLVGVLRVASALLDPGLDHRIGSLALGEGADVVLEALLLGLLHDGPLAVVDGAVSATALGGLLQHEHLLPALVGADERRPHARAAVADNEQVALVVPGLGGSQSPVLARVSAPPALSFAQPASAAVPAMAAAARPAPFRNERRDTPSCSSFFMKDPSSSCPCGRPRAPREASRLLRFRALATSKARREHSRRPPAPLAGPLPLRLSSACYKSQDYAEPLARASEHPSDFQKESFVER